MKRYLLLIAVVTLLAVPMVAGTEEMAIPAELNWTPYPPAGGSAATAQEAKRLDQIIDALVLRDGLSAQDVAGLRAQGQLGAVAPERSLQERIQEFLTSP